ncbi:MAG: glycosyltransferase family 4 protein [Flavobacteriales bacterium]|nr:glycosyltransferase family 4 protein [Flavobacteriales bacterium]
MKILYFSGHPNINLASPSGPGTHMREVIEAMEASGHQVVRLIRGGEQLKRQDQIDFDNPWYKRLLKWILPEVIWQSMKDISLLYYDKGSRRYLQQIIDREKPDLIYERGSYLLTTCSRVCRENDLMHIIELNAPYPEEKVVLEGKSWLIPRAHRAEHVQIAGAAVVVVVSSALRDAFARKYPRSESKIIVTPNAINPAHARVDADAALGLRKSIGMVPGERVIGFVGSIFKYHGVDRLIEAFERIRMKHAPLRLLIVGDGIVLPELRKYVEERGLANAVYFAGNVPHEQVYNYISLMDVAVMATSNWYGSPVKVFEYGALQKAIIAPDNGPLRDVMEPDKDGLLVSSTPGELESALDKLLGNQALCEAMGLHFHNKVMQSHTWMHVVQQILERVDVEMEEVARSKQLSSGWNKRVVVLRTDFSHHGAHSGYKQLLRYLRPFQVLGIREGEEDLVWKPKRKYQWLFEFDIRKFRKKTDLIHVMYAEDYLRFSPWMYRPVPVIATFHQPPETLLKEISTGATRGQVGMLTHFLTRSRFRRLAAAIVTESNQKEVLSKVMPAEKIHVIPLGVHLERFHSAFHQLSQNGEAHLPGSIITVGNWLRDWDMYLAVAEYCRTHFPDWKFTLVNRKMPPEIAARLDKLSNVKRYSDVSDDELKCMLFNARVHFLPVLSASGNNALMEGLAMGCPAVMTDVVSDGFPLRTDSVLLHARSDRQDAVRCLKLMLEMPDASYSELRKKTFELSSGYDWKSVAARTLEVYKSAVV